MARYEHETDKVTSYQRILLQNVEKIELGPVAVPVERKTATSSAVRAMLEDF